MKKFKLWDKCFCLCLDKRKEHWKKLVEDGKEIGLEIIPYICGDGLDEELIYNQVDTLEKDVDLSGWGYSAAGHQINHYNAFSAHLKIIKTAKENGYKSILLCEDDAYIIPSRFEYVINKIENNNEWIKFCEKFHLIYLSWWSGSESDLNNQIIEENWKLYRSIALRPINPNENIGGLHGVIIRENVYDFILNCPFNNPLDSQFCHNRINIPSLQLQPKIMHTKSIYSYTEGIVFDRLKLI